MTDTPRMTDMQRETVGSEEVPPRGLSTITAVGAAAGALVFAFLLYGMVGFPENIPLAFGVAVLLAEVVESIVQVGAASLKGQRLALALLHAVIVAAACWLGVWMAGLLGWT